MLAAHILHHGLVELVAGYFNRGGLHHAAQGNDGDVGGAAPTERILESIHAVLERTPPELVADVSTNGIMMTGGGSMVYGFDKLITSRTGIATSVAENAISSSPPCCRPPGCCACGAYTSPRPR